MTDFLWWSGVAFWGAAGCAGLLWLVDPIIDFTCRRVWSATEFMAFVADRIRSGKTRPPQ